MRWSKLQSRISELLADDVRDRVRLHVTRYRRAHDQEGRWAIVLDGAEIGGVGYYPADWEQVQLRRRFERAGASFAAAERDADALTVARGRHTPLMFVSSVFDYLNTSVDVALHSDDAVLRTLAVLDRRIGRRRIASLPDEWARTPMEAAALAARRGATSTMRLASGVPT